MKKIRYIEDCKRIQGVLFNKGFDATLAECEELWLEYSDKLFASWLSVGSYTEEYIWEALEERVRGKA